MPSAHRRYAEWTPDRFRRWGRSIGSETEGLVIAILANRPHPEQGFRTCVGVRDPQRVGKEDRVIVALKAKKADLSGELIAAKRRIVQFRADLERVFASTTTASPMTSCSA